jgi:hypothetical protein
MCDEAEHLDINARFRAHVDLWMHSNNLMWTRLQPLYFIQASYFAVVLFLSNKPEDHSLIWVALGISAVMHSFLIVLVVNERQDRNKQGLLIWREFGFDVTEYRLIKDGLLERFMWFLRGFLLVVVIYGGWWVIDLFAAFYAVYPAYVRSSVEALWRVL